MRDRKAASQGAAVISPDNKSIRATTDCWRDDFDFRRLSKRRKAPRESGPVFRATQAIAQLRHHERSCGIAVD